MKMQYAEDNQKYTYTKEDALHSLKYVYSMIQSFGNDLQRQLNEMAGLVYMAGRFIEEELEKEKEQDNETGTVCEKEV